MQTTEGLYCLNLPSSGLPVQRLIYSKYYINLLLPSYLVNISK